MIRPALITWQEVSEKLIALTNLNAGNQRDETIASIEACIDMRDKLQPQIAAPFTVEEEVFGKELIVLEKTVEQKLTSFRKQIRLDISGIQSKKGSVKSYVNPYSNVARDGAYYDTKQ
ncbi:hypothetical protein FITA111629_14150 [Filibacter tadaridae]|uniref:Flagellar protein FliT n=1 Tax=Filibacter tadaridae TaxID=2483811 RepID=A0A3P5X8L5_9BACL|nr:hypothetical protein [Filibacter tadaridae]VDC27569.1 hypothetical protein FILTAD_01659 [Filibacter tadaridae]